MNEGLVTQRKSLVVLLGEKDPVSVTKKGDTYHFDASVIATLGKALAEDLQRQLRLPVLFYASPDSPGSFSCSDETALAALQQLGEVSTLAYIRGGEVPGVAPDRLCNHEEVSHGISDRDGGVTDSPLGIRPFVP